MKPIVVVTGFGPFKNNPINASWEAVKLMNKESLQQKYNIELIQLEISVSYHTVDALVPVLWKTHTPKLMIHVGVSQRDCCLTLETQASRQGYKRVDIFENCPANQTCTANGDCTIGTKLNVGQICEQMKDESLGSSKAVMSKDAGRYLCEYIYYTSLSIDSTRTLFIHVPGTDKYPPEKTARELERVLELCLEQLSEDGGTEYIKL